MNETIITKNVFSKNISKKLEWDVNVPDIKKDVLKILCAKVDCMMEDYSLSQGSFSAKVIAMADVLYIPDGEENDCICTLNTQESFVIKTDIPTDISWDSEDVRLKISSDNCVMLNSRKLGIRCDGVVSIELYSDVELPALNNSENAVFDSKTADASYVCAVANEKIGFSSQFALPSGKSAVDEILFCDTSLKNCELKAITNKAVLKGDICVDMLYTAQNGAIENVQFSSPFTEIADVSGVTDDMEVLFEAGVKKSGVSCDSNGTIMVEGAIALDIKAFMQQKLQYVCDAYSPDYEETLSAEKVNYVKLSKCFTDSHYLKEVLSFDDFEILEIYSFRVKSNVLNAQMQGAGVLISANLVCTMTYRTQSGIRCDKKILPFEFMQDAQLKDCYDSIEIISNVENFSYVIAGHNCVEIRCNVVFNTHLLSCEELSYISRMDIDKSRKKQPGRAPVVAYFPKKDERVFDVSKKYCTTPDKIRFINSLGNSDICPKGSCIIIE